MADPPPPVPAALRLDGLLAGRGRRVLAGRLDLVLAPGGALLVTGANGAGKSTLLRTGAGLVPALGGRVLFAAGGAGGEPATPGEAAHYLGHRNAVKAGRTAGEELAFWRRFLGRPAMAPAAALEAVGLGAAAAAVPAGALSAGQARRLALARLLVAHRPVWILDEPTGALDASGAALALALCERHRAGGGAVVAATHLPFPLHGAQTLAIGAGRQGAGPYPARDGADMETAAGRQGRHMEAGAETWGSLW